MKGDREEKAMKIKTDTAPGTVESPEPFPVFPDAARECCPL